MFRLVKSTIQKIDRLLPALLLAMLLSLQSIVASGAADYITFPELIAPDGSTLSFADICNTGGDAGGHVHECAGCFSRCHGKTGDSGQVNNAHPDFSAQPLTLTNKPTPQNVITIARPELRGLQRRGPPAF